MSSMEKLIAVTANVPMTTIKIAGRSMNALHEPPMTMAAVIRLKAPIRPSSAASSPSANA